MKKASLLTIVIICSLLNIKAQEINFEKPTGNATYFITMNVHGSAEYIEAGSNTPQNVVSGMILPETGILTLSKKSILKLCWKDQILILSKKGTYSLKNEVKKLSDSSMSAPVLDDFLIAMAAASEFVEPRVYGDVKRDVVKSDSTESSSRGAQKAINIIMPIGGIVTLEQITFSWTGICESDGFRMNIFNKPGQPVVFSAMTMNNSFTIDVAQLSVEEGEEYSWQVENVSNPDIKSELATIIFTEKYQDLEVIRGLQSDREYSYSDSWLKLLREAHALQKANMLYATNEKYKQGLKEFGSNLTIKKMYARFLKNNGLEALAYQVFE